MGSKEKSIQQDQKAQLEKQLAERLAYLKEQELEPAQINKDTIVKNLRAKVRAIGGRLRTIDGHTKRTEELAQLKAEKLAAPKKESKKKQPEPPPAKGEGKKKKKEKEA
ncbi:MAG: hypothetical protein JW736_00975 [Deltaproteobacteria bacterium]|nr:hypothetical protein [Deltaproteobacteria bacterium]MBN2687868.1 hypothetical protein [Deltaproteobacteria bacterium]